MRKLALFFLLFMPFSLNAAGYQGSVGPVKKIDNEFIVGGHVVQQVGKDFVYWFSPLEQDHEGIKASKGYLDSIRYGYFIDDPFVFQFRMAAINPVLSGGVDLVQDNWEAELMHKTSEILTSQPVLLRCNGIHILLKILSCYAYDANEVQLNESFLTEGLAIFKEEMGYMTDSERDVFLSAVEEGRSNQRGVWRPFATMFRGL